MHGCVYLSEVIDLNTQFVNEINLKKKKKKKQTMILQVLKEGDDFVKIRGREEM